MVVHYFTSSFIILFIICIIFVDIWQGAGPANDGDGTACLHVQAGVARGEEARGVRYETEGAPPAGARSVVPQVGFSFFFRERKVLYEWFSFTFL